MADIRKWVCVAVSQYPSKHRQFTSVPCGASVAVWAIPRISALSLGTMLQVDIGDPVGKAVGDKVGTREGADVAGARVGPLVVGSEVVGTLVDGTWVGAGVGGWGTRRATKIAVAKNKPDIASVYQRDVQLHHQKIVWGCQVWLRPCDGAGSLTGTQVPGRTSTTALSDTGSFGGASVQPKAVTSHSSVVTTPFGTLLPPDGTMPSVQR